MDLGPWEQNPWDDAGDGMGGTAANRIERFYRQAQACPQTI